MKYKQQVIGTYRRVLREERQECQDTSGCSGCKEQYEVYAPKRFPATNAVDGSNRYQEKQQQSRLHRRDSFRLEVGGCQSGNYDFLFRGNQRAGVSFLIYDSGFTKEFLQVERNEHHQPAVDGPVCLTAHAQVHAETFPGMPFTVLVQQVAEGDTYMGISHIVSILQGAVNGFLYQVTRTRGAVVVEEVVAVHAVFREIVLGQQLYETFFLLLAQIEGLLPDVTSQIIVFGGKILEIGGSQPVVRFSEGKAEDEVGSIEIEYAVIEYGVDAACEVFVTDGGMPEERIYFSTRGTCQQTDAYGIGGISLLYWRLGGSCVRAKEKEYYIYKVEQVPFHGCKLTQKS